MDNWIGHSLVDYLNIPAHISYSLMATVADFIHESSWFIPPWIARFHPQVCNSITSLSFSHNQPDKLAWINVADGILTMKEAYIFIKPQSSQLNWCKNIWSPKIPPSKAFVTWRLYHDKMPTDEHLKARGLALGSICSLYKVNEESSEHLFFRCRFARTIWTGLQHQTGCSLDSCSIANLLIISDSFSPLAKTVMIACIINAIATIWYCRNQARFNDLDISLPQAMAKIKRDTAFTGNICTLHTKNSIAEF
ncbi:PREDICTED: uncharacterized protein LOC109338887 [Lupinus angustifolius]|uniref:uncharacterized protein LOC109338887 n=1 Tax=Lupinus angustifolius TaxID=3871 RepID=UPI00092F864B|nr:PREDICTED: uncharacterized protein LOC109338887 [Lupinus angustifolius]